MLQNLVKFFVFATLFMGSNGLHANRITKLYSKLLSFGFKQSSLDLCHFIKRTDHSFFALLIMWMNSLLTAQQCVLLFELKLF